MNEPTLVYSDNHLFAVNKPAGWLTQPSGTSQSNIEDWGKAWIKEAHSKPGSVFLNAVHRLDKPVSGIVMFARTSKALSRLNESLRAKEASKKYWACIESTLPEKEGTLENYLVHDDFIAKVVSKGHPDALKARLHYRVMKQVEGFSWVEIELETGRYHQIRAQLSSRRCPIVGDTKYGSGITFDSDRILLHHRQLSLPHPIGGAATVMAAPLPEEWPRRSEWEALG